MNRLKEARFFARKVQWKLMIETGINAATISRIECGYIIPNAEQRKRLSLALGRSEEWLFPESDKKEGES